MVQSKGWDWDQLNDKKTIWNEPSIESFYLLNRWENKKDFLDLGCGLGRHSLLFALNDYKVDAFDISDSSIEYVNNLKKEFNVEINTKQGDMLTLPYEDNSLNSILCYNVISHTDTEGFKKVLNEINRILKKDGECYITLGSKETWGYKQNWPVVDNNTKLRMQEGPEYKVPHFYVNYEDIKELFKDFNIISIRHICEYITKNNNTSESWHYHILISKK